MKELITYLGMNTLWGLLYWQVREVRISTQVSACMVDNDNKILSQGYNGLPRGCSDDDFPWDREGSSLETKYPYVVHAELNAILNSRGLIYMEQKYM